MEATKIKSLKEKMQEVFQLLEKHLNGIQREKNFLRSNLHWKKTFPCPENLDLVLKFSNHSLSVDPDLTPESDLVFEFTDSDTSQKLLILKFEISSHSGEMKICDSTFSDGDNCSIFFNLNPDRKAASLAIDLILNELRGDFNILDHLFEENGTDKPEEEKKKDPVEIFVEKVERMKGHF